MVSYFSNHACIFIIMNHNTLSLDPLNLGQNSYNRKNGHQMEVMIHIDRVVGFQIPSPHVRIRRVHSKHSHMSHMVYRLLTSRSNLRSASQNHGVHSEDHFQHRSHTTKPTWAERPTSAAGVQELPTTALWLAYMIL